MYMNDVSVCEFAEHHADAWDRFVDESNNGTLFNKRAFLAYHPAERFIEKSLLFFREGTLIALLPAAMYPQNTDDILYSHPGASYGGLIVRHSLSMRDTQRIVHVLIAYAREKKIAAIDMTLTPSVYLENPNQQCSFFLLQEGFQYRKRELTSVLALNKDSELILSRFTTEARRALKRADKLGVVVGPDDDFETFYDMLQKNLQMRHNVRPTHTLEEIRWLKDRFPDHIHLYTASADGNMCAGVLLFDVNPRTSLVFYICHAHEFQQYRGLNALFFDVFKRWANRDFHYLDFGTCTLNMKPNWGLIRFKEGFGARMDYRDSLRLQL